jgi:hypothetical protein
MTETLRPYVLEPRALGFRLRSAPSLGLKSACPEASSWIASDRSVRASTEADLPSVRNGSTEDVKAAL